LRTCVAPRSRRRHCRSSSGTASPQRPPARAGRVGPVRSWARHGVCVRRALRDRSTCSSDGAWGRRTRRVVSVISARRLGPSFR